MENQCVHSFIHTLGTFSHVWYVKKEIRMKKNEWDHMTTHFIRDLFTLGKLTEDYFDQDAFNHIYESGFHKEVACGNVNLEPEGDDLEGLRHLTFKQFEGEQNIEYGPVTTGLQLQHMNLWKYNISSKGKQKLTSIRDYQYEQTTKEIFDLLREYEYFLPAFVANFKGTKRDLGEMNIMLKLDVRLIKHHPYILNPGVKEKGRGRLKKCWQQGLSSQLMMLSGLV